MFESYEEEVSAPSSVEATDTGSITDGYGVKDHSFVGAIDEEVGAAAARAENEIFGAVQMAMAVEDPEGNRALRIQKPEAISPGVILSVFVLWCY